MRLPLLSAGTVCCLLSLPLASALPIRSAVGDSLFKPHPLVLWHGLGDSAHSPGIRDFIHQVQEAFPGIYVHSVDLGASSDTEDRKQGFFGHVNDQIQTACQQLASLPELHRGFDAVGFSQGGQFLRAYVERCNAPPVRNLITFGSQHMGIADLPACGPTDLLCRLAETALRGGIYTDYAQSHLVSAQYYRNPKDPNAFARYLAKNDFIRDINNEGPTRNQTYADNLLQLDNFVMVMFDKDATVEPKQSSWFASYPIRNATDPSEHAHSRSGDVSDKPTPLRQSEIYTEDRIGLKKLDERGGLVMELCHGVHMQVDEACSLKVFGKYIGYPHFGGVPRRVRHGWAWMLYRATGLRTSDAMGIVVTNVVVGMVLGRLLRSLFVEVAAGVAAVHEKRKGHGQVRLL
ncbi:hypothetical protein ACQY0O_001138 [Thecaphora frezii]